jgi:hypothetical protein
MNIDYEIGKNRMGNTHKRSRKMRLLVKGSMRKGVVLGGLIGESALAPRA